MSFDRRLSGVLHGLLHLENSPGPMTSEQLALAMDTHPVVVRRLLASLRDNGWVRSQKGHGGGWSLSCDFNDLTLRDIHEVLGAPNPFAAKHKHEAPSCPMEQAVNAAIEGAMVDAESVLLRNLGRTSLASVVDDYRRRLDSSDD